MLLFFHLFLGAVKIAFTDSIDAVSMETRSSMQQLLFNDPVPFKTPTAPTQQILDHSQGPQWVIVTLKYVFSLQATALETCLWSNNSKSPPEEAIANRLLTDRKPPVTL
jgi:hypothetical protein